MKPPPADERRLTSFDGSEIAYHRIGKGLPILLANGLGGSYRAWTHQIEYFLDRYQFISWDYRGLYRSGPPASPESLTVADHTQDALAILDAEGIERCAVFGWSMGVQVGLELFRHAPDRVASLVLLNGVAGHPWESVLDLKLMARVLPRSIRTVRAFPSVAHSITRRVVHWPEAVAWAKRVGLAAATLDEDLFRELSAGFADLDMGVYMRTLELLGEHDASDVLPEVDVPTLVIAGDRDVMTPRRAAESMVRRIRGAELMIVPGGTHYVAVEYPELVNLRIDKFFRERGYAADGRGDS